MIKQHEQFINPLDDFCARDPSEIDMVGKVILMKSSHNKTFGDMSLLAGPFYGID